MKRICSWCSKRILANAHPCSIFCSRKCRQAAWRIRQRSRIEEHDAKPLRFAYLDPPYPGMAWLYKGQRSYNGEVDHAALIARAERDYDGFALSTSAQALANVLPLFTRPYRVCAWVKPIGVNGKTFGMHNAWEPLLVVPGRQLQPGKRDWLAAQPARRGGDLIGRKPEAFCCWLFDLLGMVPGDQFDDLFPGTGIVGRAWAEVCRASAATAADASQPGGDDT
jgi:hypothetical protein